MAATLDETILRLRARYRSDEDPAGRGFVPLAEALLRAGRLDEAAQVVEEGTALLPAFATGHLVAAWVARERGDAPAAEDGFLRVLALDPLNVRALRDLGRLRSASGDTGGAEELFLRAAEVDGGGPGDEGGNGPVEAPSGADPADGRIPSRAAAAVVPTPPAEELPTADPGWFADSWEEDGIADDPPFPPDGVHTRTMAELYASQGLLNRAVEVFRDLAAAAPEDMELAGRLAELEALRAGPTAPTPGGGTLRESDDSAEPMDDGAEPMDDSAEPMDAVALFLPPPEAPALDSPFTWTGTDGDEGDGADVPVSEYLREILEWSPGGDTAVASPGTPTPVARLAPDSPLPEWVPVAALAPDGPVPHWVPADVLAPGAGHPSAGGSDEPVPDEPGAPDDPVPDHPGVPDGPRGHNDPGAPVVPDDPEDPDDSFRAWLEGIRL